MKQAFFAITSCCFVGFLFRYLRKSYIVGSCIDYGIPDAVGKCDAVTPFIHKVWQDYRW